MISRRRLLRWAAVAAAAPWACGRRASEKPVQLLNDVHSRLNPTRVAAVAAVRTPQEVAGLVREAAARGDAISVAGGRHAMGGQQFGADTLHLDTRGLDRFLSFDSESGTIEVEAGVEWPALIDACHAAQRGAPPVWGIRQKQTGADRMTLGGALASNIHGRGLTLQPIVGDVESVVYVDAGGELRAASRTQDPERFGLLIGGYGLFGILTSLVLRLAPRVRLRRIVRVRSIDGLAAAFEERIRDGFLYGDFQFMTDERSPDYLRKGVFSCYHPEPASAGEPPRRRGLGRRYWEYLLYLAHHDKRAAYDIYNRYYLATHGRLYWSDTHQLTSYLDGYHSALDRRRSHGPPASEMITELYVPRPRLTAFLVDAAALLRELGADLIYGTVRMIEPESDTFLPWARRRWACTVLNLHVEHTSDGIARAAEQFRALIDLAIAANGSYYLTYHRWARRRQVERCHPEMPELLRRKRLHDPDERFQSDWYRHYRGMFDGEVRAAAVGRRSR